MTKVAHAGIKYVSYSVAFLVGIVLVFFGVQSKNEAGSVVSGKNLPKILGETASADHDYAQATYYSEASYYSQSTYYSQSSYYSQAYYQSYYQARYGDDDDDDGGADGGG